MAPSLVIVGAALPGDAVFQAHVTAEMPAFIALLLLCIPAYFVLQGRDPKRYVVGVLVACVVWFVAFYPNFASLPVPTPLSQIHLGLLPTWNWGFQFGVNLDEPNRAAINWTSVAILMIAVTGLYGCGDLRRAQLALCAPRPERRAGPDHRAQASGHRPPTKARERTATSRRTGRSRDG